MCHTRKVRILLNRNGHMLLDKPLITGMMLDMRRYNNVRTIVKWVGGKQRIARDLAQCFPAFTGKYFEPFCGGGSVFLALGARPSLLSDSNKWLIDCYRAVRRNWRAVARILEGLPNTRADFLRIRAMQPSSFGPVRSAAHFIYLNKTCFRGLFRVNRKGQFNTSYGAYKRRYFDPEELEAFARQLDGADLRCVDYMEAVADAKAGDFVYFDPPYHKLGGYSDFDRYTAFPFRDDDHVRLARLCHDLSRRGVKWALSNSDTPFIRKLYDQFRIAQVLNRREINLMAGRRTVVELLVTNYDLPGLRAGNVVTALPGRFTGLSRCRVGPRVRTVWSVPETSSVTPLNHVPGRGFGETVVRGEAVPGRSRQGFLHGRERQTSRPLARNDAAGWRLKARRRGRGVDFCNPSTVVCSERAVIGAL